MFEKGKTYLIQTVTLYFLAKVVDLDPMELKVSNSTFVVETGDFTQAFKSKKLKTTEPFNGSGVINRASIIAAWEWTE